MFENLETEKWLEYNAKLQQKKNALRKELVEMGILKNQGVNDYDGYQYFDEAQYKNLFTNLFSKHGLELKPDEEEYKSFVASGNQPNGRQVRICFKLIDIETGFFEEARVTGEGFDKGDKAGYKADTGALKYYLANTFMVATGDDPEKTVTKSKPEKKQTNGQGKPTVQETKKASPKQVELLAKAYTGENLTKLLEANKIEKLEDISMTKASELLTKIYANKEQK